MAFNSLEEMCELVVDCPHSTPKWTESGYYVLRNQNIRNGVLDLSNPSFTDKAGYESRIKRATPKVGDIVFTREAPMGEVCQIPENLICCLGQRQVLLRPKDTIDGDYLFWALQSPQVQHQISWNEGTGSTVSNVRIPVLKSLKIPRLNSLDAEIFTAKTLTDIHKKIRLNRQINQTLEEMAQAIFKSWFVDFDPVRAKMQALENGGTEEDANLAAMEVISGKSIQQLETMQAENPNQYQQLHHTASLFPNAMQDSELGEMPVGWSVALFSEIADLNTKSVKPNKEPETIWEHYSIPAFDSGPQPSLDTGESIKSNKYLVQKSAILASKLNPSTERTWLPFVEDTETAICSTEFMQFVPINADDRAFVYCMIRSEPFQHGILSRVTGTTGSRQRAQPKEVSIIQVIKPTPDLTTVFNQQVTHWLNMIGNNQKQIKTLAELRDALLPKLLSGCVEIKF